MSIDNTSPDVELEQADDLAADAAAEGEEVEEADQVERAAQGLITIGLFLAFVTFVIFCLPMYFF